MPDRKPKPVPAPARDKVARPTLGSPADGEISPREIGRPKGPEPTRYGDWEQKGRCTDF